MAEYIEREQLPLRAEFTPLDDYANGWNDCLNVISEIPAADVQPVVHGQWINTMPIVEYKSFCQVKCSVCESIEAYGNFCRNCGADMRGK